MVVPRAGHSAITLNDGRVLIIGNVWDDHGKINSHRAAEIFDPKTNKFNRVSDTTFPYRAPKLFLMPSGKVLILESKNSYDICENKLEFFDPEKSKFHGNIILSNSKTKSDNAIFLNNNLILFDNGIYVEVYNIDKDKFIKSAKHTIIRQHGEMVKLPNGKILFIGGANNSGLVKKIELYDPKTNKFSIVGEIQIPRKNQICILLNNEKVLILGGEKEYLKKSKYFKQPIPGYEYFTQAELYDYNTNKSRVIGNMHEKRGSNYNFKVILLKDGRVLISGGTISELESLSSYEIYDPKDSTFTLFDSQIKRKKHQLTLLNNGNVLVTGGLGLKFLDSEAASKPIGSAELIVVKKK